jgi:DNA-binding NarL/FixJ family response regulator
MHGASKHWRWAFGRMASHGIEALQQFEAHDGDFAIKLSDTEMPHMNGVGFIKRVRALGYKGRVLVMSGRFSASACQAYQNLEVSGFLSKPFDISMVATMIMEAN